MKKILFLACLFCLGASAQNLTTSGTISAASTANTCTATSCVYYQLPSGATWVTLQIAGTWSGSIGVYSITSQNANYQNLNSQTWMQQATLTSNGTWAVATGNSTFILVQSSSFSSGSANITMTASSTGSPLVNPILAGNLTVSGINQATASTSAQCWSTQGGVAACGYGPGTVIPISSGGTGATTAAAALTNLFANVTCTSGQAYSPFSGTCINPSASAPGTSGQVLFNNGGLLGAQEDRINVQQSTYGAKGDCVTNDSAALQSAINAAAPGQAVYIPKPAGGCYSLATTVNVTSAGVTIICDPGTSLKNSTSPIGNMLYVTGNSFTMRGCTIDANSQTYNYGHLRLNGVANPVLENVTIINGLIGTNGPDSYVILADNTTGGVYSNIQAPQAGIIIFAPFQNPLIKGGSFGTLSVDSPSGGGFGNGFTVDGATFSVQGCSSGNCVGLTAGDFSSPVTSTAFSIDSANNITITAPNSYTVGAKVTATGFVTGTYLNYNAAGIFTVTAATSTSFTMNSPTFTHAAVTTTSDSGVFKSGPIVSAHVVNTVCDITNTASTSKAFGCWSIPSYNTSLNFEHNSAYVDGQYINYAITELGASGDVGGNVIHAMDAYSQSYHDIVFYGGNVSVHDNSLYGWGDSGGIGIRFYPQSTAATFLNADNSAIVNNHLYNPSALTAGNSTAIQVFCNQTNGSAKNTVVQANQIDAASQNGISLTDNGIASCPLSATIAGNKIKNTVQGVLYGSLSTSQFTLGENDFSNVSTPYIASGTQTVSGMLYGAAPNATGYDVNGTPLAASNLTNGTTGTGAVVLATNPTITSGHTEVSAGGSQITDVIAPGSTGTPSAMTYQRTIENYLKSPIWYEFPLNVSSGNTWDIEDAQNGLVNRIRLVPDGVTLLNSAGSSPVEINGDVNGGQGSAGTGGAQFYNGGTYPVMTTYITSTGVAEPSQSAPASIVVSSAAAPVATLSTSSTGGTLAGGTTYYYRVGSCTAGGGSGIPAGEISIAVPSGTNTNTVTIVTYPTVRANAYSIYGRTTGSELLIASCQTTNQFTDTGSITPSGPIPTVDTTYGGLALGADSAIHNGPRAFFSFFTGPLTAVSTGTMVATGSITESGTIEKFTAAASSLTCTTNPTLTLEDCGTAAGTCAAPTALASVTLSEPQTITPGTVTTSSLTAGHYFTVETTGGSCSALTATGSAEYRMQ